MRPIFTLLVVLAAFGSAMAASAQQTTREAPETMDQVRLSYAPVVSDTAPAVVNVYARRMIRERSLMFDDPFFRRFFGTDSLNSAPRERVYQSLGSGVIVGADGVVVTNHHVVEGAQELRVALADRREFDAELILADERTDLAVLRIDPGDEILPALRFANSASLLVGDIVLAIGNPFGVGQTVTSGIISALGRSDVGVTDYSFFIQTDAAVNPGNSGGALVDMDGDLIGINTAIFSRSGGSNGIGFAIPAELVERVVESALSDGKVVRPWFGARGQTVTPDIAASMGLDRPQGLLINRVYRGGPADRAGLRDGDIVLSVDGTEVNDDQAVRFRLATVRIGETARLRVLRNGRPRTLNLSAEAPPETPAPDRRRITGRNPFAGVEAVNLSPAFNDTNGLDLFLQGVAIVTVERGSVADYYGLRPGDVIEDVNGTTIETSRTLEQVMARFAGQRSWSFIIRRGGQRLQRELRF